MPSGIHKSRTMRRVFVKTPGSRTVLHYRLRKPSKAICARCGTVLAGTASQRPYKMMNMAKSKKRPERPFGGVLCSRCMRAEIKAKARQ